MKTTAIVLDELADVALLIGSAVGGVPRIVATVASLAFETAGNIVRIVDAAELERIMASRATGLAAGRAAYEASKNPLLRCGACGAPRVSCGAAAGGLPCCVRCKH